MAARPGADAPASPGAKSAWRAPALFGVDQPTPPRPGTRADRHTTTDRQKRRTAMTTTTPIAGNYTDNAAVAQRLKHAAIDSLHSFRPGTGPLTVAPISDELEVTARFIQHTWGTAPSCGHATSRPASTLAPRPASSTPPAATLSAPASSSSAPVPCCGPTSRRRSTRSRSSPAPTPTSPRPASTSTSCTRNTTPDTGRCGC